MKRSEALKVIDEVYSNWCKDFCSLDINDSEKLDNFIPLNERILSRLEELGMLPPEIILDYSPLTTSNIWEKERE